MTAIPTRISQGALDFAVPSSLAEIARIERHYGKPLFDLVSAPDYFVYDMGEFVHLVAAPESDYDSWCESVDWDDVVIAFGVLRAALVDRFTQTHGANDFLASRLTPNSDTEPQAD